MPQVLKSKRASATSPRSTAARSSPTRPSPPFLAPERNTDPNTRDSFDSCAPGYYDRPLSRIHGTLARELRGSERLSPVFLAPGRHPGLGPGLSAAAEEEEAEDSQLAAVEKQLQQLDPRSAEAVAARSYRNKLVRQRRAIRTLGTRLMHIQAAERLKQPLRRLSDRTSRPGGQLDLSPSSLHPRQASFASRIERATAVPHTERAIQSLLFDGERQQRLLSTSKELAQDLIELAEITAGRADPRKGPTLTGPHVNGSLSFDSSAFR
jgi:hypothetical protein